MQKSPTFCHNNFASKLFSIPGQKNKNKEVILNPDYLRHTKGHYILMMQQKTSLLKRNDEATDKTTAIRKNQSNSYIAVSSKSKASINY